MSVKDNSFNIWKRVPHRIKGFLKRGKFDTQSPSSTTTITTTPSPPPALIKSTTIYKPSSLMFRIFPTSKQQPGHKILQHRKDQWAQQDIVGDDHNEYHVSAEEIDFCASDQADSNLMSLSLFNHNSAIAGNGDDDLISMTANFIDNLGRVYMATLQKARFLNTFTIEQQFFIHQILAWIQQNQLLMKQQSPPPPAPQTRPQSVHSAFKKHIFQRVMGSSVSATHSTIVDAAGADTAAIAHHLPTTYQRDFTYLLNNSNCLLNNSSYSTTGNNIRKSRRTRYIFLLLSTPASHLCNNLHPVTEAMQKLRKPYSDTFSVITAEMTEDQPQHETDQQSQKKMFFVPGADYLLDPASLYGHQQKPQGQQSGGGACGGARGIGVKCNSSQRLTEGKPTNSNNGVAADVLINNTASSKVNTATACLLTQSVAKIQIETN